jgi:5-(aminomethyl)-3-furanmethanol phosphate kinase
MGGMARVPPAAGSVAASVFAGPGFEPFGLHGVVKFGGSLLNDLAQAARIAEELAAIGAERPLAVFPGGGPSDKLLERMASELEIPSNVINPACMRALDQTGIVLAALSDGLRPVEDLHHARLVVREGRVPVLLPSSLILRLDVFTRFDVITSDTLGAFFAFLLGAPFYIVLTDVDGVYAGRDEGEPGRLVESCTALELAQLGHTSVDRCFGPFLHATGMPAWVIDGRQPGRLRAVLEGGRPVGTEVRP